MTDTPTVEQLVKHMTERFLSWRLPVNFSPDNGIAFNSVANLGTEHQYYREPIGTNLFDYTQAKAMVEHMLEGSSLTQQPRHDASVSFFECDENWFSVRVASDLKTVSIDHPTEADWYAVRRAHEVVRDRMIERLGAQADCPVNRPDASVEGLAGTDWFAGDVDCDGNELITVRKDQWDTICEQREKFMWQVRDTCARAEKAEAALTTREAVVEDDATVERVARAIAPMICRPVHNGDCDDVAAGQAFARRVAAAAIRATALEKLPVQIVRSPAS